jgi:hypothetical protein
MGISLAKEVKEPKVCLRFLCILREIPSAFISSAANPAGQTKRFEGGGDPNGFFAALGMTE